MNDVVVFENLALVPIADSVHGWLLSTGEVELGFDVPAGTIRSSKSLNAPDLIEGKHFVKVKVQVNSAVEQVGYGRPPAQFKTMWTKRGVVRLGFLLEGARACRFRDFAEDLVMETISAPQQPAPTLLGPRDLLALQLQVMDELAARTTAVEISQRVLADEQAFTNARLEQVAAKQDRRDPAEDEMVPVTVTTIGSMLVPMAAGARTNKLMQAAGLQWQQNGRWVPTHEGRQYAVIIPVQHASGRWHESLQWQKRVVPVLERRLARRATLRSVS